MAAVPLGCSVCWCVVGRWKSVDGCHSPLCLTRMSDVLPQGVRKHDRLSGMSIPHVVSKAHATGNDFVMYVDPEGSYEPTPQEIRALCDRHRGVGADGLIRLTRPEYAADVAPDMARALHEQGAAWFMDYRNADGSLAQMCGNGTRATALMAQHAGHMPVEATQPWALGTRAGVKWLTSLGAVEPYGDHVFQVHMGPWRMGEESAHRVMVTGACESLEGTYVDMGNPHVVAVLPEASETVVDSLDLTAAPVVTPGLAEGQNVEFTCVTRGGLGVGADVRAAGVVGQARSVAGVGRAVMRVYERGCGETLSCGTGLCATAVMLRQRYGMTSWDIQVRGGVLRVDVADDDIALTGDAVLVGDVTLNPAMFRRN